MIILNIKIRVCCSNVSKFSEWNLKKSIFMFFNDFEVRGVKRPIDSIEFIDSKMNTKSGCDLEIPWLCKSVTF